MPTYVSMLTWSGHPQPAPADVRAAIDEESYEFRARGLHSLVFLPDRGMCAAIMVSSSSDDGDVEALACSILPEDDVFVTSMRFDDVPALIDSFARELDAPSSNEELVAVYQAVVAA